MEYRFCKYWQSPMLHSMSLVVIFSYYMYLEVAEEDIDQTWKDNNIFRF